MSIPGCLAALAAIAAFGTPQDSSREVDRLLGRARFAIEAGDCSGAAAPIERLLVLAPDQPEALALRGHCRYAAGDLERALRDFDHALRLDPGKAQVHYARGQTLRRLERKAEAITSYSRALELRSEFVDALNARGMIHAESGDRQRAIDDWSASIAIRPGDVTMRDMRASLYLADRNFVAAASDLVEIVRLAPRHASGHRRLGTLLAMAGSHARAIPVLRRAVELDSRLENDAALWLWVARRDAGEDPEGADAELRAWLERERPEGQTDPLSLSATAWLREVGLFLLGERDVETFLGAGMRREQELRRLGPGTEVTACKVAFFQAVRHAARGEVQEELRALIACLATLDKGPFFWEAARLRLTRLAKQHAIAARPGFVTKPTDPEYCATYGLDPETSIVVSKLEVEDGAFAHRFGLEVGDVLVEVNGRPASREVLGAALSASRPGDFLEVVVQRGSSPVEVSVLLGLRQ